MREIVSDWNEKMAHLMKISASSCCTPSHIKKHLWLFIICELRFKKLSTYQSQAWWSPECCSPAGSWSDSPAHLHWTLSRSHHLHNPPLGHAVCLLRPPFQLAGTDLCLSRSNRLAGKPRSVLSLGFQKFLKLCKLVMQINWEIKLPWSVNTKLQIRKHEISKSFLLPKIVTVIQTFYLTNFGMRWQDGKTLSWCGEDSAGCS